MLPRVCIRFRLKHFIVGLVTLFVLDFFGAFTHFFEEDFYSDFHYPYEGDVAKYAKQIRNGERPDVSPINFYNYTYLSDCKHKCRHTDDGEESILTPRLVFIIKSAMDHFDRRSAIRQSWGFEKRFSDVMIRTVFVLGTTQSDETDIQSLIDAEQSKFNDIVQADFVDTYFNNTIKTMMGIKWAVTFCPGGKFFMFVDDDFYVSAKNVLRFLRNPINYPEYLEEADEMLRKLARRLSQSDMLAYNNSVVPEVDVAHIQNLVDKHSIHTIGNKGHVNEIQRFLDKEHQKAANLTASKDLNKAEIHKFENTISSRKLLDVELPNNVKLFSGFVFSSAPHRHRSSKWYVPLEEYPWHMWPPYVTAGAFILSREALYEFYYISMYTKHFRFDDIYLGLVAMKANIEPLHSEEFYFHKALYAGTYSYRYVLATHGYNDPKEMVKVSGNDDGDDNLDVQYLMYSPTYMGPAIRRQILQEIVNSLPVNVQKRINALKNIDLERFHLEAKFYEEMRNA